VRYHAGISVGPPRARLPRLLLCPGHVEAAELLAAAGDDAGYFVVGASTPEEVRAAGRRLAGPLRMPEFPDWVQARR
jgi:hypothetical protein